jgi:hypothetical protein
MEAINLGGVKHSPVTEEIVLLAGKHIGLETRYVSPEAGSHKGYILVKTREEPDGVILGAFWEEFDRLQQLIKRPLDERILPDNYPVKIGYMYTVNGSPQECLENFQTVGKWKTVPGVEEIRRCDIYGRIARLPFKQERETGMSKALNSVATKSGRTHRKGKKTYKIKNMI